MDLGKIGDQNVEFLKGHLFLFCATKLAQPSKSYGHSKIEKGEKKCLNMKNFIFFHKNGNADANGQRTKDEGWQVTDVRRQVACPPAQRMNGPSAHRLVGPCLYLQNLKISSKFPIFLPFAPVGPPNGRAQPTDSPTSRPTANLTAHPAGGSSTRPTGHEWPPSENKIEIFEQIFDFDPLRPSGGNPEFGELQRNKWLRQYMWIAMMMMMMTWCMIWYVTW